MKILIILSFLISFLFIISLLYFLINIVYLEYIKRRKFIILKKNIVILNKRIKKLKNKINELPDGLLIKYNDSIYDKITKIDVNINVYVKLKNMYKSLIEHKQIVNSIDDSIYLISKSKSDIEIYMQTNYPNCEKYIKSELNNLTVDINMNDNEYTINRMNKLIKEKNLLDNKLNKSLTKIVKINNIVVDYQNINKKIDELTKIDIICYNDKKILEHTKVGNRYHNLSNINLDYYADKMKNDLNSSLKLLNDEDFDNAILYYGNYVTCVSLLNKSFNCVINLLKDYNNSNNYIKSNSKDIINLTSKIEEKIFKLGVKICNRNLYSEYKNDILIYKKFLNFDIISASEKHKEIIKNLEKLLNDIDNNITSYYKNKKV